MMTKNYIVDFRVQDLDYPGAMMKGVNPVKWLLLWYWGRYCDIVVFRKNVSGCSHLRHHWRFNKPDANLL